ncbi:hypothetical protein HNQ91_002000 [Filimonas zeae]|uniref:hypothetical protein n=1 Tax=Filimonas zeae TaxID=1737353 RepID=UPI00166F3E3A|nr:hypothetical protein [Filimonas zeae]MDR6338949.1 hypothetical protein [Filimonas zeae]
MLLFALIAAGIWQEAYSYSGINKWEKRLKNTLSLMAASILYAFYIRWLLRRQWTRFTD